MVGHEQANSLQQESLKRLWIAGDGHCSHFELDRSPPLDRGHSPAGRLK
jgi:hypothetical protein